MNDEIIAGHYKVIKHIGMGSYGHSYLVFDLLTSQKKVLKALRLHKRITPAGRKGFALEKKLLSSIDHPGFPKYFEDGIYKNIPFFTMEFIDGKTFEQLIFSEGRKISEIEAFKIMDDLLQYIEYLHSQNIIHRDIRIPNVLLEGSKIRLIDLGLAVHLRGEKNVRAANDWDIRREGSQRADFYGLGHFLLFLLYSNYSFDKYEEEKSWSEELNISSESKQIIKRLLQIEPAYEHCTQIRADIKKIYKV